MGVVVVAIMWVGPRGGGGPTRLTGGGGVPGEDAADENDKPGLGSGELRLSGLSSLKRVAPSTGESTLISTSSKSSKSSSSSSSSSALDCV